MAIQFGACVRKKLSGKPSRYLRNYSGSSATVPTPESSDSRQIPGQYPMWTVTALLRGWITIAP